MNETRTSRTREQRKIAELARDYRRLGYTVRADCPGFERPSPMGDGFLPDLVARRGDETVVVEVKSSATLKQDRESMVRFASAAQRNPTVRFDLVVTNPRPQTEAKTRMQAHKAELRALRMGMIEDLHLLAEHADTGAVLLVAYRILEALVLRTAVLRGVSGSARSRNYVDSIENLRAADVITGNAAEFLVQVGHARNAYAHGATPDQPVLPEGLVERTIALVKQWTTEE